MPDFLLKALAFQAWLFPIVAQGVVDAGDELWRLVFLAIKAIDYSETEIVGQAFLGRNHIVGVITILLDFKSFMVYLLRGS